MYFHKNQSQIMRKSHKQLDQSLDISTQSEEAEKIHLHTQTKTLPRDSHDICSSKIKRSLCRNFTDQGYCPYGEKCQFAHGTNELRNNMPNNHSYKTRPCFTFINNGYCLYGQRCNFIHEQFQPAPYLAEHEKWREIYAHFREDKDMFRKQNQNGGSRLLQWVGNSQGKQ